MGLALRWSGELLTRIGGGGAWHGSWMLLLATLGCSEAAPGRRPLTADVPLHLEEHLEAALVEGSQPAAAVVERLEWTFEEPRPEWRAVGLNVPGLEPPSRIPVEGGLRLHFTDANRNPESGRLVGAIYVDLPDLGLEDWSFVEVEARASGPMRNMGLDFNFTTEEPWGEGLLPFAATGDYTPLVADGSVRTYRLSLDVRREGHWDGPWTHLGIWLNADETATIDILSVRVLPREAVYVHPPVGVRAEVRGEAHRRSMYVHTPATLEYLLRVPDRGRLDLGLGVLRRDIPVTFEVSAEPADGETAILLEETVSDRDAWTQRFVDLTHFAGRVIRLRLETRSEAAPTVAFWAAPTLTGDRTTSRPNVIFYVIDGGSSDHMSLYDYNRRTTPNLERLAEEGAIFERTYSNATWTTPSTSSFLTSLHTSVLGGYKGHGRTMLPDEVLTMGEHLHRAGYQTAGFTTNGYAGTGVGLERGLDVFRDADSDPAATSSEDLHEDYWRWRETYPGEPYWVHFQTTDVHRPFDSVPPFAGLYVRPELRRQYDEWEQVLVDAVGAWEASIARPAAVSEAGIDTEAHFEARRGLMDEAMAQQDFRIGRLVERLRATGEWERTLLIVASDHGPVGIPSEWSSYEPMFRRSSSRVPLLIVWPGRIQGGQRFRQPVSMIDVLPTLLDLLDLPMPEVAQGQSLAPLLLGESGWESRPVILDEFEFDRGAGELRGVIEVVDGRWAASLEVNSQPDRFPRSGPEGLQREVPLLLYDLWEDPQLQRSLHEERPDLVEKYTRMLEQQWRRHLKLGEPFRRTQEAEALTPEQLRTLRSLGYID